MNSVYFDNAATTPMYREVVEVMSEAMLNSYGNPSSTHHLGRKAKVLVESSRKKIAEYLNVLPRELVFTSSGTEANNLVLRNAVENLGVKKIITSKIEHHAVLHVVDNLNLKFEVEVEFVSLNENGEVDLSDLQDKLSSTDVPVLVSLMWVNNEIGNILPVEKVSNLCREYNAIFHTDAVQAIGHFNIDLKNTPVDFLVGSGHKFHGPKGVGFLYANGKYNVKPMILGGGQERGIRSSTENVHAVLGMQKALEVSLVNLDEDLEEIKKLKLYFIKTLQDSIPDVRFNGSSGNLEESSVTILNVRFPFKDKMLLFNLDLQGVCASVGSACQSGGAKVSHVLKEVLEKEELDFSSIRFSFSKFSTIDEVDFVMGKIIKTYSLVRNRK
ncbi:cysteine desulfurase family protein [Tenacibaculum agarivorans]|uniref:cysteine desulfurase family protein n=1 Tax=Tenacibaculum agarivorans TaxID=1908389 RepID=UPI00094B7D94|nr:cysteine desulfurase family protein [Tenacibaculum agarivorans]